MSLDYSGQEARGQVTWDLLFPSNLQMPIVGTAFRHVLTSGFD